jgi:hypothetical protein
MNLDRDQPVGLKAQLIDIVNMRPVARAESGSHLPAVKVEPVQAGEVYFIAK